STKRPQAQSDAMSAEQRGTVGDTNIFQGNIAAHLPHLESFFIAPQFFVALCDRVTCPIGGRMRLSEDFDAERIGAVEDRNRFQETSNSHQALPELALTVQRGLVSGRQQVFAASERLPPQGDSAPALDL